MEQPTKKVKLSHNDHCHSVSALHTDLELPVLPYDLWQTICSGMKTADIVTIGLTCKEWNFAVTRILGHRKDTYQKLLSTRNKHKWIALLKMHMTYKNGVDDVHENCVICLRKLVDNCIGIHDDRQRECPVGVLYCSHRYHTCCFDRWKQYKLLKRAVVGCPLCNSLNYEWKAIYV